MCLNSATFILYTPNMFNLTNRGKMTDRDTIDMVKGLTDAGNSTMEIIKMQKQLIDLLSKRVGILEDFVFRDVRKNT
mgnify:CR=1 FL=1